MQISFPKKKELLLFFISSLISLILGVLILDYYSQKKTFWHGPNTQFDKELGWTTIPNLSLESKAKKFTTNSLGFRSPEVDSKKEHILVVGDSVVWGAGVNDDETMTYYLDKQLTRSGLNNYQILNLGVSGYGIGQYFLHLKRHIQELNPKVIITIIHAGNDFEETSRSVSYGKSKPLFINKEVDLLLTNTPISKYSCNNLVSRSLFFGLEWWNSIVRSNICDSKYLSSENTEIVINNLLGKINLLAAQYHAQSFFVINPTRWDFRIYSCQPAKWGKLSNSEVCVRRGTKLDENVSREIKNRAIIGQRSRIFEFEEIFGNSNHQYYSYFKNFRNLEHDLNEYYVDNDHYSSIGNLKFSNILYDFLLKRGLT
jgi:hypothetical protein